MNDIDTERIKRKFYTRLMEEEKLENKKAKFKSVLCAATIISLTGATVFAANSGAFSTFFRNFNDVSGKVQSTNVQQENNGVLMKLTGYLADDKGIVPELVFSRDDGSMFAGDTMAVGTYDHPSVKINGTDRSVTPKNVVSDDGKTYYCLPIIHCDIGKNTSSTLDITVDKLIYNISEINETINLNLYDAYKKADVKTLDNLESPDDMYKLFDGISDDPVQTDIGTTIDAVAFAKVKADHPDAENLDASDRMPPADGIDEAALYEHQYNNIVAIKYKTKVLKDNREYAFRPVNLLNNGDPFGMGLDFDGNTGYSFFRVDDFENLKNMNGINFVVNSHDFISGKWHIKTDFAANQSPSTVIINKRFDVGKADTVLTLTKADISLLSTNLRYEVKNNEGNTLTKSNGYDLNTYYLKRILQNEIKLRYSDCSEIKLTDFSFTGGSDGVIDVSYDVEMTPDIYTLMNTNKLSAIIVNGESFKIN